MILQALNQNTAQAPRSSPQPSLQVVRCPFRPLISAHAQLNASNILTVQRQAATAAHSSVKNALTTTFSARTTKLILPKSPLLVELKFSNCAIHSARRFSPLVLTANAVQMLATNANPGTMVNFVTLLSLNLILPKFLMAAQPRTSSSKSAKIQRLPRSYALLTRSRLLDADAAQSKARSATLRLTERTAMVMYWTEAVFTKAALRD